LESLELNGGISLREKKYPVVLDDFLPMEMTEVQCCLCLKSTRTRVGQGRDFEYFTTSDTFSFYQCDDCSLVFLNPRPSISEFSRIYPDSYHAFEFSQAEYGLVYNIRRKLEAGRLLSWCKGLRSDARILDVGCGDGFHLDLLAEYGTETWSLHGVDLDHRAIEICRTKNLDVHEGTVDSANFEEESFDLAFTIQTVEHVENPVEFLGSIAKTLKPGARLIVVTDNTDSPDFLLFKKRHWGGYHTPRHWNLFNRENVKMLASNSGFDIASVSTQVSPVNWTYSIRNWLVDHGAPDWLYERFSLKAVGSLTIFTLVDNFLRLFGNGALICARMTKKIGD